MRKRSGFTMIEILVVIGVILILAGMLFFGGRAIFGKSREQATRTTLGNLTNMLAELDAKTRVSASLTGQAAAPADVTEDAYPGVPDRYAAAAVQNTQIVMSILRAIPLNKTAIEQMPSEQLLKKPAGPAVPGLSVNADGHLDPPVVVDAWSNPIVFVPSDGLIDVSFEGISGQRRVTSRGVVDEGDPAPAGSRPFFASAGEDGNFQTGDDNLYSFEN